MSNSRQSTQCDLEESHIQANVMTQDDVQHDVSTSFDEKEDNISLATNNEPLAKPAPSSIVRIKLNRSPCPSSFENKENEDPNLVDLAAATWRTLSEEENTCRRCITRAAKSQFGQKRARKSTLSYLFPCDVGMKAFLRKVRSLLQRKITANVASIYKVGDLQIMQMNKLIVTDSIVKFVKTEILDLEEDEEHQYQDQLVELISSFIFASCKGEEKAAKLNKDLPTSQQ